MLKVVAWNMQHKTGAWAVLASMDADVALLTEARIPARGVAGDVLGGERTVGRDGYKRAWAAAIASPHEVVPVVDAKAARYGRALKVPFENSRPGSWEAAVVRRPGAPDVTVISLYGLLDEKSDASVHRSLSELTPVFEDPRYKERIILGGDLNTWTGWKRGSDHLARDTSVLDRIKALGLIDCLQATRESGRLKHCPCLVKGGCVHTRTRLDPRNPKIPYQMDYLFATKHLMRRPTICEALPFTPDSVSDHAPIVATFAV